MNQNTVFRQFKRLISLLLAVVLVGGYPSPAIIWADGTQTAPSTNTTTSNQQNTGGSSTTSSPATDTSTTNSVSLTTSPTTPSNTSDSTSQTTGSCPAVDGTTAPTGSSAPTFKFDPNTCLWQNEYYSWSPVTKQYTPITPLVYTYDQTSGRWDSSQWQYNAAAGVYQQVDFSVITPPEGAITVGGPTPVTPDSTAPSPNSGGDPSTSSGSSNNNVTLNNLNNIGINNLINSLASSGSSGVINNTTAGSAVTGTVTAISNVINTIQSTTPLLGPNTAAFDSNIYGNIQGNLIIDPTTFLQSPASQSTVSNTANNNLSVTNNNNNQINNTVNVAAKSGDATVSGNTTAGNATSGNAQAIANVINAINTLIASSKSFVGVVNVYGNLNGNILLPPQLIAQLLAANGPDSSLNLSSSATNNINLANAANESITNNVNTKSSSGNALVYGNTTAGNATSGSALSRVSVLNLTGSDVIGQNTLLVFVNVMGKWVGLLMNAPIGSTAAAYGSGITKDTQINNSVNISNKSNYGISNNINASAMTGDATVAGNTTGGNATTGNASTAVNIANLMNDQLSLSSWFGVLFINIFGNWMGSMGPYVPPQADTQTAGSPFRFVPTNDTGGFGKMPAKQTGISFASLDSSSSPSAYIPVYDLSAATNNQSSGSQLNRPTSLANVTLASAHSIKPAAKKNSNNTLNYVAIAGVALGIVLLATERIITYLKIR